MHGTNLPQAHVDSVQSADCGAGKNSNKNATRGCYPRACLGRDDRESRPGAHRLFRIAYFPRIWSAYVIHARQRHLFRYARFRHGRFNVTFISLVRASAVTSILILTGLVVPVTSYGQLPPPSEGASDLAYPKRPYSPYASRRFPMNVYWGDTHLHTVLSMDAGAFGDSTSTGPEDGRDPDPA